MFSNIIIITICVVFIVDISGVIDSIKGFLSLWSGKNILHLKPFDCSLCMTFWVGLVYILCYHSLTLENILLLCLCSSVSSIIADVYTLILETLKALIRVMFDLIERI